MFQSPHTLSPLSNFVKSRADEDEAIFSQVITIGSLLWPFIWYCTVGFSALQSCPILFFPFLWPIVLGIFQLYDFFHERCEDVQDHQQQRIAVIGGIQLDTGTVVSYAFASASLFWAAGNRQNLLPSIRILVLALVICIGFIVPTNNFIDNNQRYTSYVRAAQRVFVNYSMAFIMTALVILLGNCTA
jgi:hypothetical protein